MYKNTSNLQLILLIVLTSVLVSCSSPTGQTADENKPLSDNNDGQPGKTVCPLVTEENALFIFEDIQHMTLLTPSEGGGERPLLSWQRVEGAEFYRVVLFNDQGIPYWAWQGEDTGIYVGGLTEPPPSNSIGPIVTLCMTWITTAYNAEGVPIAAGGPELLSP